MVPLLPRRFHSHKGYIRKWVSFVALMSVSALSQAQPVNSAPAATPGLQYDTASHAVGVRIGHHGMYRNASVFWQSPVWWSYTLNNDWGRIDLAGEVSGTYWESRHGKPSSLWQAAFTPTLRWWPSDAPFYLEAGFGPTLVSRTHFANYRLGTLVQFGSHVGVGYIFNQRHQVSLRMSHFSNARIDNHNDGLNVLQLDYAVRF